MPAGRFYTTREARIVREKYPMYGAKECAELIGRSRQSVALFAHKHGIKRDPESLRKLRIRNISSRRHTHEELGETT